MTWRTLYMVTCTSLLFECHPCLFFPIHGKILHLHRIAGLFLEKGEKKTSDSDLKKCNICEIHQRAKSSIIFNGKKNNGETLHHKLTRNHLIIRDYCQDKWHKVPSWHTHFLPGCVLSLWASKQMNILYPYIDNNVPD